MMKRETPIALAGMDEARRRLDRWRATRVAGAAMPEKLWAMAVQLAQRHGIYPTSRRLGLEYNKLKRLAQRTNEVAKVPLTPPTFVELLAPMAVTEPPCRIELEGQAGAKLRVELPASASAALVKELGELVCGSRQ